MNSIIGDIVSAGLEYASTIGIQMQEVLPHGAVRDQYSDDRALLVCGETVDGKLVHVSSLIGFLPRYVSFVLGQCVGDGEPGRLRADEHVVRR